MAQENRNTQRVMNLAVRRLYLGSAVLAIPVAYLFVRFYQSNSARSKSIRDEIYHNNEESKKIDIQAEAMKRLSREGLSVADADILKEESVLDNTRKEFTRPRPRQEN
uniref:Uncharacterized protein n=1 Tax=Paramoeba aestuarina TaxID=180227 RepID=A0A7S4KZV4_9EUKA|mmetsp:Transcript_2901/g.4503  ORF Transcript_2901/g.4503 Transcript_2901/m.4503 type:complete len:108 (+) Transcript_2901:49-372(+)